MRDIRETFKIQTTNRWTYRSFCDFFRIHDFSLPVLYCTLLAMAETAKERKNLESVMRSDPELNEILSQLVEQNSEDLVHVCTLQMPILLYIIFYLHFIYEILKKLCNRCNLDYLNNNG